MISSARPSSVSPAQFVDGPLDEVPVEPGGRFVGEQQRGVADEGEGGRGALGEAAGELVRVAVEVTLGERGAGGRDQGGLAQSAPPHPGQLAQALLHLGPDGAHGREVGGGTLRYESDAPSPYGAGEGALVGGQQVRVPAEHRAAGGLRVGGQQSEQGRGQDRLAAAALADQRQALPGATENRASVTAAMSRPPRIRKRTERFSTARTGTSAPSAAGSWSLVTASAPISGAG